MATAKSVRDLLLERYSVPFTSSDNRAPATIGTTAVQIFRQDPKRIGLLFVNESLNNMFLRPRAAPTSALGIRIDPNGGSLIVNWVDDGEIVAWEWFGIADGAASSLFAIETLITPEG